MKILLTAVNAKYIHMNPAVRILKAYADEYGSITEIAEYTVNMEYDIILRDICRRKPGVIAFSCYIWNISFVRKLAEDVKIVLPGTDIWLGGPEVSFDAEKRLEETACLKGVIRGEGEIPFKELCAHYAEGKEISEVPGITYRSGNSIITNPDAPQIPLDDVPFIYGDMTEYADRLVYYETSRGCPFSCSYCLSSRDRPVRFRSMELLEKELQVFLDAGVRTVKFTDRTFNIDHDHAQSIWRFIKEHDNGKTVFHFEIGADLLNDDEIKLLSSMRPGLVQLEIGVQSTNPETLNAVNRKHGLNRILKASEALRKNGNMHIHLDLIAGLPYEDLESFKRSFDQVIALRPHDMQLGFLKLLKGCELSERAEEYGLTASKEPPYEVRRTPWLSPEDIFELKDVEEMCGVYYNSGRFRNTVERLAETAGSHYRVFKELADLYKKKGWAGRPHTHLNRAENLARLTDAEEIKELILYDLYLNENLKKRPSWAQDQRSDAALKALYSKYKTPGKDIHIERFGFDVKAYSENGRLVKKENYLVFDYGKRDIITNDAEVTYGAFEEAESD
ncbi:MAG: DUF4080 domain-containing protein [Lachnospiraceae bacterium]|nr:DUF4080 domain-containing protein [Lachnospiraceae bacterium]